MYKTKSEGITLVALVVTIIILLILATISVQALTSTGLFENANKAKLETKRSQIKEWLSLNLMEAQTTNYNKTDSEILEIASKKADSSEELKKLGKSITVDGEISTEEDGQTVPPYFDVIVDNDMYKVSMEEQEFIGEVGKIVPSVDFSATTTSKSITLKIITKRNQGGTVECYIKGENDSNYGTAQTATDNQYTFDNLEQGKNYTVKVVVTSGNGQKAEKEKEYTTVDVKGLTAADVEFEYSINGTAINKSTWTNKEVKVTAKLKVDIAGYTLVTKKNDGTWQETNNQTFGENGIMYVALTDGRNYSETEATANVTNIEKNAPSVNINLSATEVTTEEAITAKVTQSDSQSGINIGSCRWVYNTTAGNIGTNASSYTGGIFTSETENISLKSTIVGTYYLHVLSADNAGNLKETISNKIEVTYPMLISQVNIGDYVSYKPGIYQYISQKGSGPVHGNGYGNQTFTSNDNIKWRVLNKDISTGEVILISENPIQTDSNTNFYLKGAIGYLYAEEELNRICSIYGYGKGANTNKVFNYVTGDSTDGIDTGVLTGSGARSINVDDINKITMYIPSDGEVYSHTVYYPTKKTITGYSNNAVNRTDKNTSLYYAGSDYLDYRTDIYNILFMNVQKNSNIAYWLASRSLGKYNNVLYFNVCDIDSNVVNGGAIAGSSETGFGELMDNYGVRPIVYLKSNLRTEKINGIWEIIE